MCCSMNEQIETVDWYQRMFAWSCVSRIQIQSFEVISRRCCQRQIAHFRGACREYWRKTHRENRDTLIPNTKKNGVCTYHLVELAILSHAPERFDSNRYECMTRTSSPWRFFMTLLEANWHVPTYTQRPFGCLFCLFSFIELIDELDAVFPLITEWLELEFKFSSSNRTMGNCSSFRIELGDRFTWIAGLRRCMQN